VAEIRDCCRRHLACCKGPHYVRFVDAFPMKLTGKVQKCLVCEAMAAALASR